MNLRDLLSDLEDAFASFHDALRKADKNVYELWKAGGFIVSDNIVSDYPNASDAVDQANIEEDSEEQEDSKKTLVFYSLAVFFMASEFLSRAGLVAWESIEDQEITANVGKISECINILKEWKIIQDSDYVIEND